MKPPLLTALLLVLAVAHCLGWEQEVPADIARDYVWADSVLNEDPCDWREPLRAIFRPAVQHCADAQEAALYIASHMTQLTGAYYSTQRRKPHMNALEALAEKKISCTGQSILLVCAMRSVGIPARAVMVLTWGHIRGNHTWVEVWLAGEWKMIEFNERAFNTPWVMENIGLLNPAYPAQRIYAAAPHGKESVGFLGEHVVTVDDVTDRYIALSRAWYAGANLPPHHQRLMVDVQPRSEDALTICLETADGQPIATAPAPTARDDMRYLTPLNLPMEGQYYLRLLPAAERTPVRATPQPAQLIRLQRRPAAGPQASS